MTDDDDLPDEMYVIEHTLEIRDDGTQDRCVLSGELRDALFKLYRRVYDNDLEAWYELLEFLKEYLVLGVERQIRKLEDIREKERRARDKSRPDFWT